MSDTSRCMTATIVGAIAGAVTGYLFFTDQGRRMRRQIEPALEEIAGELSHFRGTINKAAGVASEGWKLLNETFAEETPRTARYSHPHQTSPF